MLLNLPCNLCICGATTIAPAEVARDIEDRLDTTINNKRATGPSWLDEPLTSVR